MRSRVRIAGRKASLVSAAPAPADFALPAKPRNDYRPTDDEIRQLAYHKWAVAGKPAGDGVRFWLDAERELRDWNAMSLDGRK